VFFRAGDEIIERRHLAFLGTGDRLPVDRKGASVPQVSFYSGKADVEAALRSVGIHSQFVTPESESGHLHPTRQASIMVARVVVGSIGQIHPEIADELRLPEATFLAEINLAAVLVHVADAPRLRPISRNPAVRRDISLEIDKAIAYEAIEKAVEKAVGAAAGEVLERQWLFDVYEGPNIPAGRHSLGIALQLRKLGETFTDEEANQVRESVVAALVGLGGTTR
jgi:phenylalanyl-tRNA synthetase beta chain